MSLWVRLCRYVNRSQIVYWEGQARWNFERMCQVAFAADAARLPGYKAQLELQAATYRERLQYCTDTLFMLNHRIFLT